MEEWYKCDYLEKECLLRQEMLVAKGIQKHPEDYLKVHKCLNGKEGCIYVSSQLEISYEVMKKSN